MTDDLADVVQLPRTTVPVQATAERIPAEQAPDTPVTAELVGTELEPRAARAVARVRATGRDVALRTGRTTVTCYERTSQAVTHPLSKAAGTALWAATGGALTRVGRFYLATDELDRSGNSARQSEVQAKRAIGTGATAVVAGPVSWLGELLAFGHCDFLTWHYGPWAAVLAAAGYGVRRGHAKLQALRSTDQTVVDAAGNVLDIRPMAEARTPRQAMEYLRRALLVNKAAAEPVSAARRAWGWELTVRLLDAEPAEILKKLGKLEVRLDLGVNKLLATPHMESRGTVTFRIILADPWADMPALPLVTAGSRSIADRMPLAQRLDHVELGISLAGGSHAVVIGASGSGKSIVLRALVDGLGACRDVVLVDCDPTGVGQSPQRDLMGLVALSPEDCTAVLLRLVKLAKGRTRLLRRYGWDEWQSSPAQPAVVALVDEFPQLDKEGKAAAIKLLRIARKAGISLVFASQSNTKDTLGQAISGQVAIKASGAGVQPWELRLLWGDQAVAEGWDTSVLRPKKGKKLNDSGTWLFEGCVEGDEPLFARGHYLGNELAKQRAQGYCQAERPVIDEESLTWSGLTRAEMTGMLTDEDDAAAAALLAQEWTPDTEEDEIEVIAEVPQVLLDVAHILEDDEQGLVATADLADRLEGYTAAQLGTALRKAGVPRYGKTGKGRPAGYANSVPVWDLGVIRDTLATYHEEDAEVAAA